MFFKKKLKFKLLDKQAVLPEYKSVAAACFDLTSLKYVSFDPWQTRVVPTGLAVELPKGYEMVIRPRSGLTISTPFKVQIGTIDADYRGEVGIMVYNACNEVTAINPGTRLAQAKVQKAEQFEIEEVEELTDTERGSNGFGSTGA